ncbi:MAG: hypothetical protein FWG40_02875 [Peptococcaceae bacterium]|nr:hypothetical protein [Peptococcaceae bacterium]
MERARIQFEFIKYNITYIILALLVAVSFATLLGSFIHYVNLAQEKAINDTQSVHGGYHILIGNITDDMVETGSALGYVESFESYYGDPEGSVGRLYCRENIFWLLGMKTVGGVFPNEPESVMIEKNYAISLTESNDYDEIIGKTIDCDGRTYTVTGIYYDDSWIATNTLILSKAFGRQGAQSAAVRFVNPKKMGDNISMLLQDLDLPANYDFVLENAPLLTTLGMDEEGAKQATINMSYLIVLLFVLVLLAGVIFNNLVEMMIEKNLKAIAVYKVLHGSTAPIVLQLLIPMYVMMFVGIVGGFGLSGVMATTFVKIRLDYYGDIVVRLPLAEFFIVSGVVLVLFILFYRDKMKTLMCLNPVDIMKSSKLPTSGRFRERKRPYYNSDHKIVNSLKFSLSMLRGRAMKGIVIVLGISLSVIINVSMAALWNQKSPEALLTCDYEIMNNYYNPDSEAYTIFQDKITRLKQEQDICTVYDNFQFISTMSINKEAFTAGAAKVLTNSKEYGSMMRDKYSNRLSLPFLLLGYNDIQISMLDIGIDHLEKDECVVYTRSFNRFGVDDLFLGTEEPLIMRGDVMTEDGGVESKPVNLYPRYSADKLLFDVETMDPVTIVIVSQKLLDEWFPFLEQASYYVISNKDVRDSDRRIKDIITGNLSYAVIDHQDTNAQRAMSVEITRFLFGIFIGITALFAIINIFALLILKLKNDMDTYVSYMIMGVGKFKILSFFIIETAVYFLLSILITFIGLLLTTSVLNYVIKNLGVIYHVALPWHLWFIFEAGLLVVLVGILWNVFRIIEKIKPIPHSIVVE